MDLPDTMLPDPLAVMLTLWLSLNVILGLVVCVVAHVRRHEPLCEAPVEVSS